MKRDIEFFVQELLTESSVTRCTLRSFEVYRCRNPRTQVGAVHDDEAYMYT